LGKRTGLRRGRAIEEFREYLQVNQKTYIDCQKRQGRDVFKKQKGSAGNKKARQLARNLYRDNNGRGVNNFWNLEIKEGKA